MSLLSYLWTFYYLHHEGASKDKDQELIVGVGPC